LRHDDREHLKRPYGVGPPLTKQGQHIDGG
jgi:hypothetical protein